MSSSNIAYKSVPGQFNIDAAQGIVECFVAGIGNKDSVGDVLVTGAFTKSLTRRKPRVVWGHNWNDPIGKVLEIYEVPPSDSRLPMKMKVAGIGGLYARVQFNLNSEKGKEAFANVAFFGQEQEWSIGYKTLDAIFDPNLQANILKEVELYEVSPVLHGANQLTGTISVKSDDTAEKCGPGGMMPHHMNMEQGPKIVVLRTEDEEDDKPIFSEGLAQPIGGSERERLSRELQSRSGSPIQLIQATENTAIFRRNTSDGRSTMYRIGYHTPDNYVTFMFGKPELADGGSSGSRTVVPSQMPSMPMQVKPQAAMPEPQGVVSPSYVMPKSDGFEKSAFDEELEMLADLLDETFDAKVGRTLSSRNMSKLKTVLETLQEIVASADKDIEVKTDEYIIPVALEDAFSTKQLLDPIFDYHRVESHVSEDGIIITSGVTKDFLDAMETAQKALGGSIGGGGGKVRGVARFATEAFDPNAVDGDNDGLVQEGSAFERPATPSVSGLRSLDDKQIFNKPRSEKNDQGINVFDSHILADRMKGMSLEEAAKKHGIPAEKIRQREAREMARLRKDGSTNDIIAYRMMGVSLQDAGKMFDKTPQEIRQIEAKELAKFRENPSDDVILDFRERGLSLDEVAKMTGLKNTEVRKREQIARRDRPEIPPPDKELTDEQLAQWAKDREQGGLSSRGDDSEYARELAKQREKDKARGANATNPIGPQKPSGESGLRSSNAEIVSKDDLPKELVNDVSNAAVRAVGSNGDETRLIDGAKEALANLTDEKLKDSVGTSVSDARKKLAEMLSDENIIEQFESRQAIEDFMDEVGYSVQKMLDSHVSSVKKTGTSIEKEEIEDIVDNAKSKFDDDFNKLIKASKEFWSKRRKPGRLDNTPEEAKKTAAEDRKNLMASLRAGGEPEDLAATLGSISKLFGDSSEGITSGTISLEDLNYEIEKAIDQIVENDPSIDSEELVNEFADALREGASKDDANPLIVALAKEFGDEKITGGDLIDSLNDTRQNSVYRPDRGKIEKENIRGLASRDSKPVLGRDISYFEPPDDANEQIWQNAVEEAKDLTRKDFDSDYNELLADTIDDEVRIALRGKGFKGEALTPGQKELQDDLVNNLGKVIEDSIALNGDDKFYDELKKIAALPKEERLAALKKFTETDGLSKKDRQSLDNSITRLGAGIQENYVSGGDNAFDTELDGLMKNNAAEQLYDSAINFDPNDGESGLSSRGSRDPKKVPYGSGYSANLSEDEISQLKEDLKDIDGVQDIVKRLNEATPSQAMDSQRIRMTPQELDKWLKDIETAREGMSGIESNVLGDIEDILTRAKNDAYNNFTSPSVSRRTRPLRTESGTINAHPKLDIELSQDEIGLLREEIKGLIKNASKPEALTALDETLSKASNGKFSISAEEYNSLIPSIEESKKKGNLVTSDLLGLLEDVADSKDGKYSSIEIAKTGAEGGIGKPKRLNSGAPADITVGRQRELIDWARQQKGLRIAQSHVSDFDKNKGQLSPSQWRALETLHTNLGPGGGGLRSSNEGDAPTPRSSKPGGGARGIGDVTRGETSRGRQMGGEQLGERDKGKVFDDLKPDNWDDLDNEEKLDWMLYEGSPAKSGMKPIDHERVLKELFAEEEKINARKERDARRAARPADWIPPKIESKPLDEAKPAKKRPTTKEAAAKQRDSEMTSLVDFVSSSASRVDSAKQTDDIEAAHEDIWTELDDVLSGSEDLTRSNISAMIESLNTYIDDYSGNTNNSEEGKNVTRAKKLLKTLEDLDVYYEDDTFISDGDVVSGERPSFGTGGLDSRSGLSSFSIRRNKPEESKTPKVVKPKKKLVTDNWKKVGGQGGSQPGGKFADENGKEFYVKEPKTLLHAENESLVSKLYAALGVKAADVEVGEHKGKPKIVSEWVPGAKTGIMGSKRSDPEWRKKVQSGFVADAWLANWDALGNADNIAIGGDGEAYRVDTGGGILFRARGAEKGSQFGSTVGEMESLRNPSVNSLGASYYGDITPEQIAAQVKTVGALSDTDIRDMVSASISDPSQAKKISDTLIARRDDLVKNWSTGVKGGRSGMSSRSEKLDIDKTIGKSGITPASLKKQAELKSTIDEWKKANEAKYGKPGTLDRTSGLRSSSAKPGRTMITDEATYFGEVESSLPKEIEAARKANDKATAEGLQKLLDLIKKQEASKTGSRRTNVGSIYATRDEVDQILDAMMVALDRQMERGEGKGENRIKMYSKLIEMLAAAGMSTFIDRDTDEIGSRTTKRTNSQGRNISIPNT
jgi:hypothetical protein